MKTFFQKIFGQKGEVNYFYFSCFLLFLTSLSLSHSLTWDLPLKGIPLFFFLYAIGQSLLEVLCFVLIAYILKRWSPKWFYYVFISVSFLLMLIHFTHFIMVRLLDASIVYIFKFFFGSGYEHLIAGFQALNMNWTMVGIIVLAFLIIPVIGIGFYSLTFRLAKRHPLSISLNQIALTIGITATALFLLDVIAHPFMSQEIYSKYQKSLPLGTTFMSPIPNHLLLEVELPQFRDEAKTIDSMPVVTAEHLPNIYLFIIETFRRDYLYAAPNLSAFGKDNIQFKRSFANASCTYLSWFAIFHADLPLYWAEMRDTWKRGSIPLQMLKNMGYQISAYSSANLRFFSMDKLIFGENRSLADKIEEYSFDWKLEPCDRDLLCFNALKRDLKREGQVYLIFLDSTHSEYSFPENFPIQYEPIAKEIDYLTIGPKSPELEMIKNRYRNAIDFVDQNMGKFFDLLKEQNLYEDAIIAITGDHGEEFFEDGALFHGTHLNECTTSVPLFFKFPSKDWIPQIDEATHMHLFPSILHYLTKQSDFRHLFDGRSIFSLDQLPFRIAVLQNGPNPPFEFFLEQTDLKVKARFVDRSKLQILELQGSLEPDIFAPLLEPF